ncbi:Lrp/AsnC family transcriptional regulator [Vibrio ulleungensis]|uniref:Lrp/AsnC family transcriptional regulator n=1 Tax=Vibrio ulleungensis TaxID=2807619 RepID=A0ABS2HMY1_9VIBR|nr:Lrp/AsnC family transcriptional regulator [Vibrio ulleungensis]MBM7037257.1 Lrp/AsnC family transcriptional regulator [Vibrio ulleungensis]
MDNFDHLILTSLQLNNKKTSEELGAEIGLSATAVQRRIKKLRELGVIEKEVAILNSNILGGYVTVIVDVTMVKGGTPVIDEFKKKALSHPEVQQCYYVAGEKDFILIITAKNMQRYEAITRELFLDDDNILKFTSNVTMQSVKMNLSIPI